MIRNIKEKLAIVGVIIFFVCSCTNSRVLWLIGLGSLVASAFYIINNREKYEFDYDNDYDDYEEYDDLVPLFSSVNKAA